MTTVKIKKSQLLEILKKNCAEHRDIFLKAQEGYRAAAIIELDRQLELARNSKPFKLHTLVAIIAPSDFTSVYQQAIKMLEMSVEDDITLTDQEFRNYVLDKWNWSGQWASSNSRYTSSAKFRDATEAEPEDIL